MSISNDENLNKVDHILIQLFNNVVTDEKIKKTKLQLYSKNIDMNIDKNFGWKYYSSVFLENNLLKTPRGILIDCYNRHIATIWLMIPTLIINMIVMAVFFKIPMYSLYSNISFAVLSIFFVSLSNIYVYQKNKKIIKSNNMKEMEKLNFFKDDMREKFVSGDLLFAESYLENEKVDKNQLAEILKYIKNNISEDEVFRILKSNRKDDITDLNVLYEILLKIKYRLKEDIKKEPKFTSRDIFRIMTMDDENMSNHKEEIKLQ